jgi:hypothetical protein
MYEIPSTLDHTSEVHLGNQVSCIKNFLQSCIQLFKDPSYVIVLQNLLDICTTNSYGNLQQRIVNHPHARRRTSREFRLNANIGDFNMGDVILDLGFEVNVLPKKKWKCMGEHTLGYSPIQMKLENQHKDLPIGRLKGVTVDLDGVRTKGDFEVIKIVDDTTPYLALLGLDWEFENQAIINLKTRKMKFIKKDTKFQWNESCQQGLDTMKENMVTSPILVFPDWEKTFHVHVCASAIALGAILAQPGVGELDHPIAFASRKLSDSENNYNTTEQEGMEMVYALQKFRNYLLGKHFKMFTNHLALKYLVNKSVLGGRICQYLLLFQEFDFEVIVKQGRLNARPVHLSRVTNGEETTNLEDTFLDVKLFSFQVVDDYFVDIIEYLSIGTVP